VLGVHDRLLATGYSDPELLRAALLHDAGKADCRARVGITHRVLRVLLKRFAPGLLGRLATGRPRSHRLYLAEHHARLGAEAARHAGASERCCWLIANHERDVADVTDSELLALIAADEGTALP
jgi:HD superfamily phosphodiesterase